MWSKFKEGQCEDGQGSETKLFLDGVCTGDIFPGSIGKQMWLAGHGYLHNSCISLSFILPREMVILLCKAHLSK